MPLEYETHMLVGPARLELATPCFSGRCSTRLELQTRVLVATVGIEPTTFALSRRYSTTELRGYGMVPSEGVEPSSSRFVGATPVPLDQVLKYFADRPGIEPGSFSVNSGAPTPCLLAVSKVLLVLRRRRDSNPYHPLNRRITIH